MRVRNKPNPELDMAPVTNQMLNARREKDCLGITTERKYYHADGAFIKRSLRPDEWQTNPVDGTLVIPRFGNERVRNEAAAMRFVASETSIPLPRLYGCFEDGGAVYLVMEYIDGVTASELSSEQRKTVEKQVEQHLHTLHSLTSDTWGGPSGIVVPPYRVMARSFRPEWKMQRRASPDLVFCHNDLSTHNIIVDPRTLQIKAILDWEYAGFFPAEFEGPFFRRPGPSVALDGEVNDEEHLLDVLYENEDKA
ncbi:hypothetical protein VTK73DRAFT_626 [Phialemonium thermophilum]|uniref:Aminoglycoside phosphotransferase domain-containing protein n=1 Tax=Phialemonium thermophilum TaxID=223376 RepID=A0ABR3VUK3_9PEZI